MVLWPSLCSGRQLQLQRAPSSQAAASARLAPLDERGVGRGLPADDEAVAAGAAVKQHALAQAEEDDGVGGADPERLDGRLHDGRPGMRREQ